MKLRDYLKQHEISSAEFAKTIGLTEISINRYAAGTRIPRPAHMRSIAEATDKAVTANDFFGIVVQPSSAEAAA